MGTTTSTSASTGGSAVNILMVDDQPAKLITYEAILADLDVNLMKATSARAALELLLKHEIAIVLMDVSMPEIDGFELAGMIRQHPRFQRTAIIFISAVRLTDLDRLKGYEVGAVDYIPVPVIPEILRAKVGAFAELYRTTRQLAELNRDLERRVEERTAALEKALVVRDEFLSVAAHELKTPLTGLRATAQVLTRKLGRGDLRLPDWLDQGLHTIDQQADRLARLVEQLLDMSRLDQEKLAAEREPTDLSALTERLVGNFRARSSKHNITLDAARDLVADVDAGGIERVLSNLLDNAIKYSPDGGPIDVELHQEPPGQVYLAVRDHGIGIPEEKRAAIFERFYQAHADDHRSGLGLGLYISHRIVAQHGGQLAVEFPPDGGTRFVLRLPAQAPAEAPTSMSTAAAKPKAVTQA